MQGRWMQMAEGMGLGAGTVWGQLLRQRQYYVHGWENVAVGTRVPGYPGIEYLLLSTS